MTDFTNEKVIKLLKNKRSLNAFVRKHVTHNDLEIIQANVADVYENVLEQLLKEEEKLQADKQKAQEVLNQLAEMGISLDTLTGLARGGDLVKSKQVIPVKYKNEAGQTWTGRGRQPKWVVEFLKSGGDLNDCLI